MIKVKGKIELCSSENYLKYFKSIQGLGSFNIFEKYAAIETIIEKYINTDFRDFLAQPNIDKDKITWFCKPYNDTPKILTELEVDELLRYTQIKSNTLNHFIKTISNLKEDNKYEEAELLSNAIKFINDDFIYCFDNKIILGIWGIQLRNNVREPIGSFVKNLYVSKKKKSESADVNESEIINPNDEHVNIPSNYKVRFQSGNNGNINGISDIEKCNDELIYNDEIPEVLPNEGFEFIGWDKDPNNFIVNEDIEFIAQYKEIPPVIPPPLVPWYIRFWNWLKNLFLGRGCLKWLLWLLLFLLLLFLLSLLFRSCNGGGFGGFGNGGGETIAPIPSPIDEKPWIDDDPNVGKGGKYNPGDPYNSVPTPPEYGDVLPPFQGELPPIDSSKIVRQPGEPVVIGNRLNVLMENIDKSIMDLAKDFKAKYPSDEYSVVYYDDVVKRMQIEIPEKEREKLKNEIPSVFAPEYDLFVFDEALFESRYTPTDPAFSDSNKSWYLKTIKAPNAWGITLGSPQITIAVVDNGFSLKHPEISNNIVMPYNVWSHSNDIFAQSEDHGTHVAGTALAAIDNDKGICGVAPNSAFMPIQVADKQGLMTTTSVLDGVLYALYQGADVINISLGLEFSGNLPESVQKEFQENRFKEEERLWNHVMKISTNHNTTIVIAAGNNSMLAGVDPMNRPKNFIVVSAIDKNNTEYRRAGFSNHGDYSTISAPGVEIYSSIGKNDYAFKSGTSMAAPIVTGSVALMKSLNINLTSEEIICILQGTGLASNGKIGNLLQLDKALEKVKSGDFNDCNTRPENPSTGDVQILLSWDNYNDLDLACIDPFGNTLWFKNKEVSSGGLLEIDMNVNPNESKSPIENIYWPPNKAPNGTYQVYLWLYKQHEQFINETNYKILVKYGDKNEEYSGTIKREDGRILVCTFTLGDSSVSENPNNGQSPPTNNKNIEDLKKERERLQKQLDDIDNQLKTIDNTIKK